MMLHCEYRLIIFLIVLLHVHARSVDPWSQKVGDLINKLETFRDETVQRERAFNEAEQRFKEEKHQVQTQVNPHDVVRLNVGGQLISTRRETLLKVPNSLLHSIFDGTYEHALQRDRDGSYFLDYNPLLFTHLLDQLRDLRPNEPPVFRPPPPPASAKSFNEMLNAFKLPVASRQGSDLVVFNVGGEIITTLRQTLLLSPESKLARLISSDEEVPRDRFGRIFLNYNPRLFRILLNEIRHGKKLSEIKIGNTLALSDQGAFDRMLDELKEIKTSPTVSPTTTPKPMKKSSEKPTFRKQKPKKSAQDE